MKFRLVENYNKQEIIKAIENFFTVDPHTNNFDKHYIMPDGKVIFPMPADKEHAFELMDEYYITDPDHQNIDIYLDAVGLIGGMSPTEYSAYDWGGVRVNTMDEYYLIDLPDTPLTRAQYDELEYMLDITSDHKEKPLTIYAKRGTISQNYPREEYDTDEIIKRIRRFYTSGNLYI